MTTTAYPPSIGGVQSYVADLCAHLKSFDSDVLSLWSRNRTDWLLGTTLRLRDRDSGQIGWSASQRRRMAPWVLAYYATVPLAARRIAAIMAPALERLVRPEHVLIHNHRIGREFLAQASLDIARKRGLPFVLTPHHHPRWHGYRYSGWTNVYRAADAVLTVTEAEKRQLAELGVSSERMHYAGGGADEPLPADSARFRSRINAGNRAIVLFVGQLYEHKGVERLLEASDSLHARGAEFELVFAGPHTPFSRRLLASRQRPWLHVLGSVDDQTKWDAIEAASMLCLPSSQEAFGRVFLEAWSKRKPVIGGRIPAVREVVTDGETGLLVDTSSTEELGHAIESLLSDHDLARRLGENGFRARERRFTWARVAERVEAVYENLLARNARA